MVKCFLHFSAESCVALVTHGVTNLNLKQNKQSVFFNTTLYQRKERVGAVPFFVLDSETPPSQPYSFWYQVSPKCTHVLKRLACYIQVVYVLVGTRTTTYMYTHHLYILCYLVLLVPRVYSYVCYVCATCTRLLYYLCLCLWWWW